MSCASEAPDQDEKRMGQALPKNMSQIEKLLRRRERMLIQDVNLHRREQLSERQAWVNEEVGDEGDASVANVTADVRAFETARDVVELRAIDAALARLKDGSFGHCIDCGDDIGRARLKANPTAIRCIDCQRHRERTHWESPARWL
jgi:DnaK suppressor protein